jgi:tetratricopeptide (TPR) repeat protein
LLSIKSKRLDDELKKNEDTSRSLEQEKDNKHLMDISLSILSKEKNDILISSSPVGTITDNTAVDFYVYEWFIKDTGEIFYVGKGRGNRYKEFHRRAYEAERIRKTYETDIRFVGVELTEEQAIDLENLEITRILNETNDRLTNRIIPLFTKRDNGYNRSPHTPKLQFETAPYLYASEIEEHFFNLKPQPFDIVKYENLKTVVYITRNIRNEIETIYDGNMNQYLSETKDLLSIDRNKTLKSKYAKTVTAWVYIGDEYLTNHKLDQEQALEKLGRNIPTYHLIDVWKLLKEKFSRNEMVSTEKIVINPIHNRVPIKNIKNLGNWSKGYEEGSSFWEKGDIERKSGDFDRAIELFDIARYNGYIVPALYKSYAMVYRKLKDYDNEAAIMEEAVELLQSRENNNDLLIMQFKDRRAKALELKDKRK